MRVPARICLGRARHMIRVHWLVSGSRKRGEEVWRQCVLKSPYGWRMFDQHFSRLATAKRFAEFFDECGRGLKFSDVLNDFRERGYDPGVLGSRVRRGIPLADDAL